MRIKYASHTCFVNKQKHRILNKPVASITICIVRLYHLMNQISIVSVLYLSNSKYQKKYIKKAPCMALFKITYEFTDDENVTHKIRDTKLVDYNRDAVNRAIQSQLVQLDESLAPHESTSDDYSMMY